MSFYLLLGVAVVGVSLVTGEGRLYVSFKSQGGGRGGGWVTGGCVLLCSQKGGDIISYISVIDGALTICLYKHRV